MKKNLSAILVSIFIFAACAHNVENLQENFTPPVVKELPKIFYPVEAQQNSYYGITKVVVIISKDGTVNRTVILKSSGHDILDESVVNYCNALTFHPAIRNGEPVESRVIWKVDFNFLDQKGLMHEYPIGIAGLNRKAGQADYNEKILIEREILNMHSEFIKKMNDALNFNTVIAEVILPELVNAWKKDWNAWPLSFLLYEDFIERYPDYDSLLVVKKLLENAARFDIEYIRKQPAASGTVQKQKEIIIIRIKQFILNKYPELLLDMNKANASVAFEPRS